MRISDTCFKLLALAGMGGLIATAIATHAWAEDKAAFPSLEELYKGTYQGPPTSAPKPVTGKKIWVISCSQDVSLCAAQAQGITDAGKLLGWTTTVFDGKYDPATQGNGIRQAIAGKYDAVVIAGADCAGVKAPLEEARQAGMKVVGIEGADCSVTSPGEQPLFHGEVSYVEGDVISWVKKYGEWQADYIIARTKGKAKVIVFVSDEVLISKLNSEGTIAELKRCSGCEVYEVKFSYASQGPELQQLAEQALLRFPDANGIAVPADSLILSGMGSAIEASGRDIIVMGAEGQQATMDLVRAGSKQVTAGVGIPSAWEGYSAVDMLNRLFQDKEPVGSGAGLQVYDKDHNAGTSGAFSSSTDFIAGFKKAWGISQ
ncbi:substrate-binding domain-containing protein [Mesorhizobium sp. WSM4976]|uniref:sugar ABC transporter substrate-binding protein n=1 Tax=Mesorhizobium sp. WSM4976 TaxID=3038549 RepID=UPI0024169FE9|nr:substrate-binding domain-containing protein [Mesorhizobium sp. WSM4976]MDG4897632.1 substrate-binding domain-containing protein [Mesorhizobium sp. WSM4976]